MKGSYKFIRGFMSSLIGYGVKFASIRVYFNEKGVDEEDA